MTEDHIREMEFSEELSKELETALEDDKFGYDKPSSEFDILNLQKLADFHQSDLKLIKALRKSLVTKRDWITTAIATLDKRIEVNLVALQVLQTPEPQPEDDLVKVPLEKTTTKKKK